MTGRLCCTPRHLVSLAFLGGLENLQQIFRGHKRGNFYNSGALDICGEEIEGWEDEGSGEHFGFGRVVKIEEGLEWWMTMVMVMEFDE